MKQTSAKTRIEPGASLSVIFRPIESRNTFEETVERLTQAIKLGAVQPGTKLPPERDLVRLLGISRATLREAIRVLQQAGYVESQRGRTGGAVVLPRSFELSKRDARRLVREMGFSLLDALDFRRVVEPGAAELAALRASPEELRPLYAILEEMSQSDAVRYRQLHPQLHLGIAQLAQSPSLSAAVTEVQFKLNDILAAVPLLQAAIRHSDREHVRILDAIAKNDPKRARLEMERHLEATERLLKGLMD